MSVAPDALWSSRSIGERRLMAGQIVAVIVGGLALERWAGVPGQHLTTAWTIAVFGWCLRLGGHAERRAMLVCTALAAFGEAVLSLGWGLYDYRFGNLPLYVPPGHALLMTLGLLVRPWVGPRAVAAVAVGAAAWALGAAVTGADQLGAALALLFLGCAAASRGRDLYAAMLLLALAMELYGTAVGAWTWRPVVPALGWSAANPPFAAGAFYALLDLLVLALVARRAPLPPALSPLPSPDGSA